MRGAAERYLSGEPVSLDDMLRSREDRAARIDALAPRSASLASLTLNIPGPVKRSRLVRAAIERAVDETMRALEPHSAEVVSMTDERTGVEAILSTSAPPTDAKRAAIGVEESHALGRLFDIDIIAADRSRISRADVGAPPRSCIICGGDARSCARSRAHGLDAIRDAAAEMLGAHFRREGAREVVREASRAMMYEAATAPKPGLVDRYDAGSHTDMDFFTYIDSVCAISPRFGEMFEAGWDAPRSDGALLDRLREIGLAAERDMMRATGGANTHMGTIFSLGIMCAALGRTSWAMGAPPSDADVRRECAALGELASADAPSTSARGGAGARGEAASGFASAFEIALPLLEESALRREGVDEAGVRALLALIARVEDTNMIHRGGRRAASRARDDARRALESGDVMRVSREMNEAFASSRLSPGGCADMLAASFFLLATLRGQNLRTSSQTASTREISLKRDST